VVAKLLRRAREPAKSCNSYAVVTSSQTGELCASVIGEVGAVEPWQALRAFYTIPHQ